MKRFIGKYEDLVDIKTESYDGKRRYYCPYCDTVHSKSKDTEGCVIFNLKSMSGYCFRCSTIITHDGLMDLDYIQSQLKNNNLEESEEERAKSDKINITWLEEAKSNNKVMEYLKTRNIENETIKHFDILSCDSPFNAVVFYNKKLDESNTDYLYIRNIDPNCNQKHTFVENIVKKPSWLNKVNSNEIILCEGFFDGLAVYQHGNDLKLNPVVLSGKTVTNYQCKVISEFVNKGSYNITICMDGGFFEDSLKIADKMYQRCFNSKIYVMILPYGKDPNEVSKDMFLKSFKYRLEYEPSKRQYIRNKVYNK